MPRADKTGAKRQGRSIDCIDPKLLQPNRCSDDIDDRIRAAHLMEVNLVGGRAVHRPFRFSQTGEDRACPGFDL